MRYFFLIYFLLGFVLINAQNDTHSIAGADSKVKPENSDNEPKTEYNIKKEEDFSVPSFLVNIGAWYPLGDLQKTFDVSINYGIRFGLRVNPHVAVQLGLSLFVPKNSSDFEYKLDSLIYITKSENKANGFIGAWFNHYNWSRNKKIMFEKYIGVGAAFIQTDIPNPEPSNSGDEYYNVRTVNLSFGIVLSKISREKNLWGWFVEYNFAPYYTSGHVETSFGTSSIVTGLQFSL